MQRKNGGSIDLGVVTGLAMREGREGVAFKEPTHTRERERERERERSLAG